MLTYEKVLEVFKGYLEEDSCCEPVNTSRGYIVMRWDNYRNRWYDFENAPTPEALRDVLLKNYEGYLIYKKTNEGERDGLTEREEQQIKASCRALLERCR